MVSARLELVSFSERSSISRMRTHQVDSCIVIGFEDLAYIGPRLVFGHM